MSQNGSKALNLPNKIGKLMSMTEKENKARKKPEKKKIWL